MAQQKVDTHELTRRFNDFRTKNLKHTFTTKDLYAEFAKMGFNNNIAKQLTRFLDSEKVGTSKLFTFKDTPVLEVQIENLYENGRKTCAKSRKKLLKTGDSSMTEQIALDILQKTGKYRIKKATGFDVERFKHDHPDLYRKYTIYEYM